MLPQAPRATLFPYTTLFRSPLAILLGEPLEGRDRRIALEELDDPPARRGMDRGQDRKSTRLNSSHTVISYAVFCLKKKNYHAESHASGPSANRPCVNAPGNC